MAGLKLPGAQTGLVYVWAIVLGPILLLAAGVVLLVMGFWRDVESVAAIGAIGIVASLLLPRMKGAFEIGASGIKGDLESDIYRGVIQQARDRGVDAEQAIELAAGATGPPAATDVTSGEVRGGWRESSDPLAATRARVVATLADQFVGESVRLERDCAVIVDRVAAEKGWDARPQVRRVGEGSSSYVFDFVITTGSDPIFIETANFREWQALSDKVAAVSAALRNQKSLAAFLVIPNTRAVTYVPENLDIVPIGDLERRLREIPG